MDSNNKSWHYIDLAEFEYQVRQEEREKEYQRRCRERISRKERTIKHRKQLWKTLPYRILGMLLMVGSLLVARNEIDCTFLLVSIPLGLLMLFCPLNSVDIDGE